MIQEFIQFFMRLPLLPSLALILCCCSLLLPSRTSSPELNIRTNCVLYYSSLLLSILCRDEKWKYFLSMRFNISCCHNLTNPCSRDEDSRNRKILAHDFRLKIIFVPTKIWGKKREVLLRNSSTNVMLEQNLELFVVLSNVTRVTE